MENNKSPQFDPLKRLTQVLLVSGGLNIALIALLFYFLVKDNTPRPYYELKPAEQEEQQAPLASDQSNSEMIRNFRSLPTEQLLVKLTNPQLVENGYSQRDLALAALVSFHHFDLSRALLGQSQPSQQRKIALGRNRKGEWVDATVFPGLSEQQYQAIVQFANTERWPLTSQGLYLMLRKKKGQSDPSLADAFFLTPEYIAVETLFNRSEVQVEKSELLKILTQGNWAMLTAFTEQQRTAQDLTQARRQKFLLDYMAFGSKSAAYLLLKSDKAFATLKLDDAHVLGMLNLLNEKTPEAEGFALTLLTSPRSDMVWQKAAEKLYEYSGEPQPESNLHHAALNRFVPQAAIAMAIEAPITPPTSQAVVSAPKETLKIDKPANQKPSKALPNKTQIAKNQTPAKPSVAKTSLAKPTVLKAPIKKDRIYIVQDGDSLWKIAKRFKIDIEVLKAYNRLQSDFLKPGSTLRIP